MFTVVSLLLAALCLLPAAGKLTGHPKMRQSAEHFGILWPRYRLIGVAELAAAMGALAGLRWHPLGLAAAAGMVLLLLGAPVGDQHDVARHHLLGRDHQLRPVPPHPRRRLQNRLSAGSSVQEAA
jgi:DoxX-like family